MSPPHGLQLMKMLFEITGVVKPITTWKVVVQPTRPVFNPLEQVGLTTRAGSTTDPGLIITTRFISTIYDTLFIVGQSRVALNNTREFISSRQGLIPKPQDNEIHNYLF